MAGRKKKIIDTTKALILRNAGFSTSHIAKELNVSQPTIWRILNNSKSIMNKTNSSLSTRGEGILNKTPSILNKSQPIQNSPSSVMENRVNKPASSDLPSTNTTNIGSCKSELPQAHHIAFSISYKGEQPTNSAEWKFGKSKASRYEGSDFVINAYSHKLVIWMADISGSTVGECNAVARGRARARLADFAKRFNLSLEWPTFEQKAEPHLNLEGELNEFALPILASQPKQAKEMGVLPGDTSHPDQVEFVGEKGRDSFNRFMWLITDLPSVLKTMVETQQKFSENLEIYSIEIKEHRAAIKDIRDSQIKIQEAMEAMRKYYDTKQ